MSIKADSIGSVTFFVEDLDQSLKFYRDKLGLEEVLDPDSAVTLKCGSGFLKLVEKAEDKDLVAHNPSFGAIDLTIKSAIDTNTLVEQLGRTGLILLKGPIDKLVDGTKYQSVYIRDPDNNLIEITTENTVDLNRFDKDPQDHTLEAEP